MENIFDTIDEENTTFKPLADKMRPTSLVNFWTRRNRWQELSNSEDD